MGPESGLLWGLAYQHRTNFRIMLPLSESTPLGGKFWESHLMLTEATLLWDALECMSKHEMPCLRHLLQGVEFGD